MTDTIHDREALRSAVAHTWQFCPPGEPFPGKTYREDGWAYVDPPGKFSPEMWDHFTSVIGIEGEQYIMLVASSGDGPKGPWKRGQMIISPEGMENLRRHALARGAAAGGGVDADHA